MTPSPDRIRRFLADQVDAWNSADRKRFLALHKDIAPGGFSVENPVGRPRRGWPALDELWDAYQALTRLRYDTVVTPASGEAAVLEEITVEIDGRSVVRHSLHTYDFTGDVMRARYYVLQDANTGDPARDRLRGFLLDQVAAWNDGRREDCFALYDEISGGSVFLEFPLGSAEFDGRPALRKFWDELQATTRLTVDHIGVSDDGSEAALYVRNDHARGDQIDSNVSIEIYRLADDGLHIRYFSQTEPTS